MAQLQNMLDNLLLQYEGYFNVSKPHIFDGDEILAYASFEQRMAKYVMIKRAEIFAIKTYEHVFFVHAADLTMSGWEKEKNRITFAEKDYVIPHKEHMYSYITLILLCDTIDPDVKKAISKFRYTKNYKWTLEGYSAVRICALDLSSEEIITNKQAKDVRKVMEQALHM